MRFNRSIFSNGFCSHRAHASGRRVAVNLISLASLLLALSAASTALAATAFNANSPVGINLMNVNYYSPEQPFLNVFRTSAVSRTNILNGGGGFFTHSTTTYTWDTGEEAFLQLDANGYPTTLTASSSDPHSPQKFNSVGVLVLRELPQANAGKGLPYPAGQYVVDYDGEGTLAFDFDATLVSAAPGHYVINVAKPTNAGFAVYITSTDPNHTGNYLRNMRIVKAEYESLLLAGNVFSPKFLSLMQNFRILRTIQWLNIDNTAGGSLTNWSQRPLPTDGGWGGPTGVPLEVVLQLCNAVGADCWLNVPHMASDDYITQMATLAHANLGTSQKVYIEYSNEVWNYDYPQWGYAQAQGKALWPNAGSGFNGNWYGMRVAQTCDIWKSVWGADASRVVCVMGAQAANSATATLSLSCPLWTGHAPCASHGIDIVAIAPYFEVKGDPSWLSASDGGLSSLFSAIETNALPEISGWEAAYKKALVPYNLPFMTYESGQSLIGNPTYKAGSPMVNLYVAANRDARMGAIYTSMMNTWKSNGGQTLIIYADIYGPGVFGEWGALESQLDTVTPLSSAPPKWQAIQNFISANHCWWSGCVSPVGTATSTPMAPTLTVK
jgi:hypothetical protein